MSEPEPEPELDLVTCRSCGDQELAKPRHLPDGWFMVQASLLPVPWCGPCVASWEANST